MPTSPTSRVRRCLPGALLALSMMSGTAHAQAIDVPMPFPWEGPCGFEAVTDQLIRTAGQEWFDQCFLTYSVVSFVMPVVEPVITTQQIVLSQSVPALCGNPIPCGVPGMNGTASASWTSREEVEVTGSVMLSEEWTFGVDRPVTVGLAGSFARVVGTDILNSEHLQMTSLVNWVQEDCFHRLYKLKRTEIVSRGSISVLREAVVLTNTTGPCPSSGVLRIPCESLYSTGSAENATTVEWTVERAPCCTPLQGPEPCCSRQLCP